MTLDVSRLNRAIKRDYSKARAAIQEARFDDTEWSRRVANDTVQRLRFNIAGRRLAIRLGRLVHVDEIKTLGVGRY